MGEHRHSESSSLYAFDAAWVLKRRPPLAGADEAGRGALAGPLVAAAAILGEATLSDLNDSKALTPGLRERLLGGILRDAKAVSVVALPAWWVDRFGVGLANRAALARSLGLLIPHAGCALADGNLRLGPEIESLPRADNKSAAVAAASIVAKVLRDGAMRALAEVHGGYGLERNRGYGTPEHRIALAQLGPCRVHRLSYAGVGP
jgi:ribonuclease HII